MGLYRPTVTRKRKNGTRYKTKAGLWWGSFRHPVSDTLVRIPLKTADKQAALTLLAEAERRAAREAAGLANPFEEHHKRPLEEHLADYEQSLRPKCTLQHARTVIPRVRAVLQGCGFVFWPDIRSDRVEGFLADLRQGGVSTQTCNHYLTAFKAFCNWLVCNGRVERNPVQHVGRRDKVDAAEYRALDDDELGRLLDATLSGPVRDGMGGRERWVLYRLAAETGFRANELRTLTWAWIDLDGDPPTATVLAAYSKHRERDTQVLSRATARMLGDWYTDLGEPELDTRVLPNFRPTIKQAGLLRADLDAARVAWIAEADTADERAHRERSDFLRCETGDDNGQVVEKVVFHSLRHTFITNVDRTARSRTVTQRLARHKTAALTDRYTHPRPVDKITAVEGLPDFSRRSDTKRLRATGTWSVAPTLHGHLHSYAPRA